MPNILQKDRAGNDIEYRNVNTIWLPDADNTGQFVPYTYGSGPTPVGGETWHKCEVDVTTYAEVAAAVTDGQVPYAIYEYSDASLVIESANYIYAGMVNDQTIGTGALLIANRLMDFNGVTVQWWLLVKSDESGWDMDYVEVAAGTSDYDELTNRPQINGHVLSGNLTGANLGLQDQLTAGDGISINSSTNEIAWTNPNKMYRCWVNQTTFSDIQTAMSNGLTPYLIASAGDRPHIFVCFDGTETSYEFIQYDARMLPASWRGNTIELNPWSYFCRTNGWSGPAQLTSSSFISVRQLPNPASLANGTIPIVKSGAWTTEVVPNATGVSF